MITDENKNDIRYSDLNFKFIKCYGDMFFVYMDVSPKKINGANENILVMEGYELARTYFYGYYLLYKNGELKRINDAIESGWLTAEQKTDIMYCLLPKKDTRSFAEKHKGAASLNVVLKGKTPLPDANKELTEDQKQFLLYEALNYPSAKGYTEKDMVIKVYKSYEKAFLVYVGPPNADKLYKPTVTERSSYYEKGRRSNDMTFYMEITAADYYHCYLFVCNENSPAGELHIPYYYPMAKDGENVMTYEEVEDALRILTEKVEVKDGVMPKYIDDLLVDFKSIPKNPETLPEATVSKIKKDYIAGNSEDIKLEDVEFAYLKTYGDAIYIEIIDKRGYAFPDVMEDIFIGGYRIQVDYGNNIMKRIYKDGMFYGLEQAWEEGIITFEQALDAATILAPYLRGYITD